MEREQGPRGQPQAGTAALRCAECGQPIEGTPIFAHGKAFCYPWHAERYPRTHPGFWQRLWRALKGSGEAGGGGCC